MRLLGGFSCFLSGSAGQQRIGIRDLYRPFDHNVHPVGHQNPPKILDTLKATQLIPKNSGVFCCFIPVIWGISGPATYEKDGIF